MIYDLQAGGLRPSKITECQVDDRLEPVLITFEMLGVGGLIVSRTGRMISANSVFESLELELYPGWLRSHIRAVDQALMDALERARSKARRVSRKIPKLGVRVVIHRLAASDDGDVFLVTFHPLASGQAAERENRFSPVEVDILECISQGCNLRETAQKVHMPYNTVRKYVQNLLDKTSCHTQAHLIALYIGQKGASMRGDSDLIPLRRTKGKIM